MHRFLLVSNLCRRSSVLEVIHALAPHAMVRVSTLIPDLNCISSLTACVWNERAKGGVHFQFAWKVLQAGWARVR